MTPPPPPVLPLATEAQILADAPNRTIAYRFAPAPTILVLQFPDLAAQGRTLNRIAALVEKRGFPRDRVLDDAELDSRIRAAGSTPETFYFGHDYPASALVRFYALAERDGIALTQEEKELHALLSRQGWFPSEGTPDAPRTVQSAAPRAALVSLVRLGAAAELDATGRAAVLRHELSHGAFFTDPAYAAYSLRFWNESLTGRERAGFTRFLSESGYDPADRDLMVNEAQAYLMHTPDPRYFSAASLGVPEGRLDQLRALFLAGMPSGWLRDCTAAPPSQASAPASATPVRRLAPAPARAPRRRRRRSPQRRSLVRRRRTPAATSLRRCTAASMVARSLSR